MRVNMNMGQAGLGMFRYGGRAAQNKNMPYSWGNAPQEGNAVQKASSMRKLLRGLEDKDQASGYPEMPGFGNTPNSSMGYADSLRAARTKKKNTALQLKRLFYNFKSISTQILRSKTSLSAKQVAGKARREVIRLRRQRRMDEKCDPELQSAIVHAQAMERVAKKKARHLLEEELMEVTGEPGIGELEEKQEQDRENGERVVETTVTTEQSLFAYSSDSFLQESVTYISGEELEASQEQMEASQEQMQAYQEMVQAQMEEMQEMMQAQMEEMQRAMDMMTEELQREMEGMMSEFMEEMSQSMKEMLEESGLADLADSMFTHTGMEMDYADYKMMKIKHRSKELREIAEADAKYLRALFNRLERAKELSVQGNFGSGDPAASSGAVPSGGVGVPSGGVVLSGGAPNPAPLQTIDVVSAPDAAAVASMPMVSGEGASIDVSL